MAGIQQPFRDLAKQFLTAFQSAQEDRTSANTQKAIILGQNLLEELPTVSPLYSLYAYCLAHCLLITWEKTGAEAKRDGELLDIISQRVDTAVQFCSPTDRFRPWYLKTQQAHYCRVKNFSARLEDDFWDHERINTLNASLYYAKSAWHVLRDDKSLALARHAAYNLGCVYMSRYLYFGRSGDLDDALRFSTMAVIMSTQMAAEFQFQSYVQQGVRLSLWSRFEDQPDEMDDALDYLKQVIQNRAWEIENQNVTSSSGSSYAVALGYLSGICTQVFVRRKGRIPNAKEYLDLSISYAENACIGSKDIDPGRLLSFNGSATAHMQTYKARLSRRALDRAAWAASSALEITATLIPDRGIPKRHGGLRFGGHGSSISSLVTVDNRTSTHKRSSIKERRHQRWIVETLEITADVLLARYQQDQNSQDLITAITTLKLSIQGIHGWSPKRHKLLFKLNQAIRERLRTLNYTVYAQIRNLLHRTRKLQRLPYRLRELCNHAHIALSRDFDSFAPLTRRHFTQDVLHAVPVNQFSWQPITPRGAYDFDMQLSTDAPDVLTSTVPVSTEHLTRLIDRLDPQIDNLLLTLDSNNSEAKIVWSMWNKLYRTAGPSLKRAELYQRALALFIERGDLEAASELSDLAQPIMGNLQLHLMEPNTYLSDISHASNLAVTMACVWLKHGRDPWSALLVLENGRELASRNGMNTVRSYGFDLGLELQPHIRVIHDQLQCAVKFNNEDGTITSKQFEDRLQQIMLLFKDLAHNEACMKPFDRQRCMWEASDGFIIHLAASKVGTFALITTSYDVYKLNLSNCTHGELYARTAVFREAIASCERQNSKKGQANGKLRSMAMWLWETVGKPIVQFLRLNKSTGNNMSLPRIKWITCGIFSQLPIHAAGIYSENSTDYMDQYAVSSYLSSIRGSMAMQQLKPMVPYYQNGSRNFTLFGMSTSPLVQEGQLANLDVAEEQRRIFASLGNSFTSNTIDRCNIGVAKNMMQWARMVHFTCHGLSNPKDSSNSRLVLLSDDIEPCTVAKIRDMDIPNALLLFLSACHSGVDLRADETDEIIHLAKAFQLAGFPTVIGNLWQAYQASALEIAANFYAYVASKWKMDQDEPDPDVFPRALHHAVCKWRENRNMWKPMDWASWVCFQ